jgi:hypothetical protein
MLPVEDHARLVMVVCVLSSNLIVADLFRFRCVEQINKASRGELSEEELKERQVKVFSLKIFVR